MIYMINKSFNNEISELMLRWSKIKLYIQIYVRNLYLIKFFTYNWLLNNNIYFILFTIFELLVILILD